MKNKILKIIKYLILVIGALVTLIPFFWMLSTSFKTLGEVYQMPPKLLPNNFSFDNYRVVIEKTPMNTYLLNSLLVTIIVTVGTLVTSILAAFVFSRVKFKGRDIIFTILLSTMMVPSELLITPNFVILSKLNLINTLRALYLPWISSMFAIFLLRQYFLGIPEELYYAAKVDGCSDFKYLIRVMVPLTKPALITIALLKIVYSWNEFLWPMIMVNTPDKRTLPVGLAYFMTEAGPNYHLLLAYASIIIVPVIFIYLLLQKYIIQGITRSGIKG